MSFDLELTGRRALVTAGTKGVGATVVDTSIPKKECAINEVGDPGL